MHLLFSLAAAVLLFLIAFEDLRSRAVNWLYFPLLAISGWGLAYLDLGSASLQTIFFLFNIFFLLLQLALLKLYFFLKGDGMATLMDRKIGWGDVLFLVAACFFFSPLNFILFYILSLIFSIGIFLIIAARRKTSSPMEKMKVPLAGLQAGFLFMCLTACHTLSHSPFHDNWMMYKLMKIK